MQTQARGRGQRRIEVRAGAPVQMIVGWARVVLRQLAQRREALRQRRALLELDDHLLKDIGLRREDALREADRLLWEDALRADWPLGPLTPSGRGQRKEQPPGRGQGAAGVKRRT